ncbi:unnamed protein product [Effrenium voratum]|uniref:Uncharacterized protein n=1 Tax=Effrenium voratum TaxID=2562239 RepID=A0AA36J636_9DINO|nr:unnamed protein product [Effrenium voratum]
MRNSKTLPAALVDFNVDKRTDVTFGTVAASRVRSREDILILRPFERWLYTLRARGPGAPADWGAFREARAPCAACEKCKETKTLDHFSDRQWERVRANQSAICLACGPGKGEQKTLKRKLPSGLARLDCRGCKLRKLEDAFPRAQLQQDDSERASTGSATIAGTSLPASCCISHTPSANCKSKTGHGGQAELSTRYGRDSAPCGGRKVSQVRQANQPARPHFGCCLALFPQGPQTAAQGMVAIALLNSEAGILLKQVEQLKLSTSSKHFKQRRLASALVFTGSTPSYVLAAWSSEFLLGPSTRRICGLAADPSVSRRP